ncbi:MAG: type II secretion system F family protein [Planctomycetes bacterium]|nr:type II secretion system F family protein [Planctomycetota bacterium]
MTTDEIIFGMDLVDIGICLGLGVSIVLFMLAIFSQAGTVELSPQREAAIATGHTDRKTVFEKPVISQFLWVLLSVSHSLAMPKLKSWVRKNLIAAGSPNYYTPEEYIALCFLYGVLLGFCLTFMLWIIPNQGVSLVVLLSGFLLGTLMHLYQLQVKASERLRIISRRIPYALDLISLAMGAGATFTEAVKTIVQEDNSDPFNVELRAMLAEIELGTTRRRALQNMSERVPLESVRSIVASVVQAEELGTPLSKVLHDQADLMRLQRSVRAENAAAKASIRILLPCLLLVMAVMITVFGPAIMRALKGGLL